MSGWLNGIRHVSAKHDYEGSNPSPLSKIKGDIAQRTRASHF